MGSSRVACCSPENGRVVIEAVCATLGVTPELVLSSRRARSVNFARRLAMAACRQLLNGSLPEIGALFGRHHTSVLDAIRLAVDDVEANAIVRETFEDAKQRACTALLKRGVLVRVHVDEERT